MRTRVMILLTAIAVAPAACGGGDQPSSSAATPAASSSSTPSGGLVSPESIKGCAGFTATKAAAILGVAAGEVSDESRDQGVLRFCTYRLRNDQSKAVSFTLGRRESVAEATASLQSEREAMGGAQAAIDRVTKSPSSTPSSEDVQGIGDEAFYSALNGAIMLRVGNVLAQVMSPSDMGLKKRVAEEVARGLRQ